jgi:hypothetical protein
VNISNADGIDKAAFKTYIHSIKSKPYWREALDEAAVKCAEIPADSLPAVDGGNCNPLFMASKFCFDFHLFAVRQQSSRQYKFNQVFAFLRDAPKKL